MKSDISIESYMKPKVCMYVNALTGEFSEDALLSGSNVLKINDREKVIKNGKVTEEKLYGLYVVYHNKGRFYVPDSYNMNEIIKVYNDKIKTKVSKGWF